MCLSNSADLFDPHRFCLGHNKSSARVMKEITN